LKTSISVDNTMEVTWCLYRGAFKAGK